MLKAIWIKHPVVLQTAWGGTRKALRSQDSARTESGTPEGHVEGNGVSRAPGFRVGWAHGSTDHSYRYRYPSYGWESLTQPTVHMHFG